MATAKGARNAYLMGDQWAQDTLGETRNFLAQGQTEANRQIDLGLGYLGQGYDTARGALNAADSYYQPLANRYDPNVGGLYQDALGLRGTEGTQRAQGAFQTGPGYQFALDQGMQALNRRRAAGGMLNTGNADADAMQFGMGLANQEYNNWLSRLGGLDTQAASYGLNVAGQRAGLQGGLANLASQYGLNQVQYGSNPRAQMALQNAQQQGQLLNDYNTNRTNLYTGAMQAGDAVKGQQQQMWGAAAQAGLTALGAIAGGPMGAQIGSSIGSAFNQGGGQATGAPMKIGGAGGGLQGSFGQYTTF